MLLKVDEGGNKGRQHSLIVFMNEVASRLRPSAKGQEQRKRQLILTKQEAERTMSIQKACCCPEEVKASLSGESRKSDPAQICLHLKWRQCS